MQRYPIVSGGLFSSVAPTAYTSGIFSIKNISGLSNEDDEMYGDDFGIDPIDKQEIYGMYLGFPPEHLNHQSLIPNFNMQWLIGHTVMSSACLHMLLVNEASTLPFLLIWLLDQT